MHGKLKELLPFISTKEMFILNKNSEMTSLKSVKGMDASTNWRILKKADDSKILKTIQINSNKNLFAPTCHQFSIEIL